MQPAPDRFIQSRFKAEPAAIHLLSEQGFGVAIKGYGGAH
jgi:hypothetical protein